jgi:hypothetical protein
MTCSDDWYSSMESNNLDYMRLVMALQTHSRTASGPDVDFASNHAFGSLLRLQWGQFYFQLEFQA